MLHNAKNLIGFMLSGTDGDIGKVSEFYFNDRNWVIRYIVVDTGQWLRTKNVLISPHAISSVHGSSQRIAVNLTKQQIEDSPSYDSDKPVSRQLEDSHHRYYGWPTYWSGSYMRGSSLSLAPTLGDPNFRNQGVHDLTLEGVDPSLVINDLGQATNESPETGDRHLRSTDAVVDYEISAQDGPVGHIHDFVIDDSTWTIRYLIVTTGRWFNAQHVLISTQWLENISHSESIVFTHTSRLAISLSPKYSLGSLITRDGESALHMHYKKDGYWIGEHV